MSVSYRSSSKVDQLKNLVTLENKMKLFKRVELDQETKKKQVMKFYIFFDVVASSNPTPHELLQLPP